MPHIAISMYPGRSREEKAALAEKVRTLVSEELKKDPKVVTVLVIIAAAASEERLGTQVTNLVILGVIALTGFQIFAIWKQAERTAGDAKTGAEIVFHIGDEGIRARQANCKGEISWDKLVKVKKIAGIYVLYLGRDKAYLMPKRVFRGSEEQIFLSMLTRNLPQEKRRGIRA